VHCNRHVPRCVGHGSRLKYGHWPELPPVQVAVRDQHPDSFTQRPSFQRILKETVLCQRFGLAPFGHDLDRKRADNLPLVVAVAGVVFR